MPALNTETTAPAEPTAADASPTPPTTAQAASARAAKGAQTKQQIVERALHIASRSGLEGLSIGLLADAMGMSKSGVFAHFGSREELQISVIRAYHERFEQEVFMPALAEPRGLPRLRRLFHNWLIRVSEEIDSGCIYISGAVEFDDRPGAVRDALAGMVRAWHDAMIRAIELAKDCGHLRPQADALQMLFELHGLVLALHHDARFMRIAGGIERALAGFERIVAIEAGATAPAPTALRSAAATARAAKS